MKHTFISWDCSFRNFFHLIDSLNEQDFDKTNFEIIYVEQRSKDHADAYNHKFGLPSLSDKVDEYKNYLNLKVLYLDNDTALPYHLGKCNNEAIKTAQGDIITVMDGDTLVSSGFISKLNETHQEGDYIINLVRHMAQYPVGVKNYRDWKNASIDFNKCLRACKIGRHLYPKQKGQFYSNKGPMISAKKEYWNIINGYDEHIVWSTSASKLGIDTCTRLEIATASKSFALPNAFCLHPWHPFGYARKSRINKENLVNQYFSLQDKLTQWCIDTNSYDIVGRQELSKRLYDEYYKIISEVINEEQLDIKSGLDEKSLYKEIKEPSLINEIKKRIKSII